MRAENSMATVSVASAPAPSLTLVTALESVVNPMSKTDVIQFVRDGVNKGTSYEKISEQLASQGILSPKTGKPYTQAGLYYIYTRRKIRKHKKSPANRMAAPRKSPANRMAVIQQVARLQGVDDATRLSLIELIAEL